MKKILLLLTALSLFQCKDIVEDIGECPPLDLNQISYGTHVYPIINRTCAIPQCHSGDFEYGDFNQFGEIKERADNGKLVFMIGTHQMPHGFTEGPTYLTTCEIETMKKWISEGAINN